MKKTSIKSQFRRYSIFQRRSTTINHAFASAMAPVDEYSGQKVDTILGELECFERNAIMCVYCGRAKAQTWDHLYALVKNNEPSGYGHMYGNLVPACKECNSTKGNKDWSVANEIINADFPKQKAKVRRVISSHLLKYPLQGQIVSGDKRKRIDGIKSEIIKLMKMADEVIQSP